MIYDNNLKGTLAKNDRKEKDSHPDIKGQCEIDGIGYWISGWQKTRNSDGAKFYSLAFQPKEERKPAPRQAPKPAQRQAKASSGFDDMQDDVPW